MFSYDVELLFVLYKKIGLTPFYFPDVLAVVEFGINDEASKCNS